MVEEGFEQAGRPHSLRRQSMLMVIQPDLSDIFSQWKIFPDVHMELPVLQWESIVSGPLSGHHQKLCCFFT